MTDKLIQTICQAIVDKKGVNVIVLDVRGLSSLTDYFIVAEGNVDRHIQAIADEIAQATKKEGISPTRIEGLHDSSGWIVLDYSSILVHIFTQEMRSKYALEEIWKEAKLVEVAIHYGENDHIRK